MRKLTLIIGIILALFILILLGGIWFYYNSYLCGRCGNSDEQIVGGCAGVYYIYWNECCENWAEENNVVHASCIGNWTVEDNTCVWICSSG